MGHAEDEPKLGDFFSRNYLRNETLSSDSARARHRISSYLAEYFQESHYEAGKYIEQELGIKCLKVGPGGFYISWEEFIRGLSLNDFLDVMTATIRFLPNKTKNTRGLSVRYDLLAFARRVFLEQNLAYEIDDKGGVHPKIDLHFTILAASLIRNLSSAGLLAAREHVIRAERSLLSSELDLRSAIRATFDAAENLLKVIFPREPQLNAKAINEKLGPYLMENLNSGAQLQATRKLVGSLIDWTEAAHFYRHATGGVEAEQPSEVFTITFVSQGFSFVRWIADTYADKLKDEAP